MSGGGIYQLINSGQGKTVLWAGLIKICEIDIHSPLPVCFLDHDHVGQALKVVDFLNEICSKQLIYFVHYCFVSFGSKDSSSLLDGLLLWVNIQAMLDDACWDPWHILVAPSKYIEVIFQEVDDPFLRPGT